MAELTVEEKRKILIEHCDKMHEGESNCYDCPLLGKCLEISNDVPNYMNDTEITRLFSKFEKLKGESTMNEHETQTTLEATIDGTIVITRAEYAYLIAKSAKIDLLEDYVNNWEHLDKDVVRTILGMLGNEESEGE